MARAKTGYFTLSEEVILPELAVDGSRYTASIDMGAYVDVGDKQCVSVSEVKWIFQRGSDNDSDMGSAMDASGVLGVQLTDQNPAGVFVRATNSHLIASGHLVVDKPNNVLSNHSDMFPDNWGTAAQEKNIISDTLYIVGGIDGANLIAHGSLHITCLITCRIATLTQKDYYAIAVQASASD